MKKDLVIGRFSGYSLPMSSLPFPADSAEYEEYCNVMNAMADEAEAFTPDPQSEDFGGRCEDVRGRTLLRVLRQRKLRVRDGVRTPTRGAFRG
jgi:hypothetical protein